MLRTAEDVAVELGHYALETLTNSADTKNGHLIATYVRNTKKQMDTVRVFQAHLKSISSYDTETETIRRHLRKVLPQYEKYRKAINNATQWACLLILLNEKVTFSTTPAPPPEAATNQEPSVVVLPPPEAATNQEPSVAVLPAQTPPRKRQMQDSPKFLRKDCGSCRHKRRHISALREKWKSVADRFKSAKNKQTETKRLNQSLSRKTQIEKRLRQEKNRLADVLKQRNRTIKRLQDSLNSLKEEKGLHSLIGQLKASLRQQKHANKKLNDQIATLNKSLKVANKEMKELQAENSYLKDCILEAEEKITEEAEVPKFKKKAYSLPVRKILYKALMSQVPVSHASTLLAYTCEQMGDKNLPVLPHKSTVARMAYELGALALVQAGESLMTSECATLCWDSTTLDALHVNEIHIEMPERKLTVSVCKLPGGKAVDYAAHIIGTVDELANTYATYKGEPFNAVKAHMIGCIKSTMSDSAPVNHCVVEQLKQSLEVDLVELNCNVHPLDGFASHTRKALSKYDNEIGAPKTGKDCNAANFIYSVSKLRYKQTGDPSNFKSFFKGHGIGAGTFVRYVGNRIHVMFHMAGVIIRHEDLLKEYLEKYCRCDGIWASLLKEMQREMLMIQLTVLGLFGKFVTGPWMRLFYANADKRSHLELVPFLKTCKANLERCQEDDDFLLTCTTDAFGQPLDVDDTLMCLRQRPKNMDDYQLTLKLVTGAFLKVFESQLTPYTTGILSIVTNQMLSLTKSASPNNIWAERTLGMVDALWRRAPNASVGFLDAKVKGKTNGTLQWLDSKPAQEQEQLVAFAVRRGAYLRKAQQRSNEEADTQVAARFVELGQARDKRMRRKIEKGVKEALEAHNFSHEVFRSCSEEVMTLIDSFMKGSQSLVGELVRHVWEDGGKDIAYWGRLRKATVKKDGMTWKISYWTEEQLESDSVDYNISVISAITDIVTGDLVVM